MRRFPEASSAYHKALTVQPDFAAAYLGLGLAEFSQQHFGAALTDFRQVTRLATKRRIQGAEGLPSSLNTSGAARKENAGPQAGVSGN